MKLTRKRSTNKLQHEISMKNKDFDSFNNDRINALRKRIDELIFLKTSWENQAKQKQKP